jgi:hypothetical protein
MGAMLPSTTTMQPGHPGLKLNQAPLLAMAAVVAMLARRPSGACAGAPARRGAAARRGARRQAAGLFRPHARRRVAGAPARPSCPNRARREGSPRSKGQPARGTSRVAMLAGRKLWAIKQCENLAFVLQGGGAQPRK